jgi:hypothetical protein
MLDLEEIGSYRVRRHLATGGSAHAYLAIDPLIDRPVVIKLLRDDRLDRENGRHLRRRPRPL